MYGAQTLRVPCTFTCRRWLFVIDAERVHPVEASEQAALDAIAGQLAGELAQPVHVVDRRIVVEVDEPVEGVVAWARAAMHGLTTILASPSAIALLVDPAPLATQMWASLCSAAKQRPALDDPGWFFQADLARPFPAGIDEVPAGPGVWLWVVDSEPDRVLRIERTTTFGRGGASVPVDVRIADRLVSRMQCRVEPRDGAWWIVDDSVSGTYYRGEYVPRSHGRALIPGMVIRVGSSGLVVLAVR